jgi:hypothetical protein
MQYIGVCTSVVYIQVHPCIVESSPQQHISCGIDVHINIQINTICSKSVCVI